MAGFGKSERRARWAAAAAGVAALAAAAWAGPPADHRQILAGSWFHAPVADDDCSVCHTMHRDPKGPFLQAPIPELCYQCHENVAAQDVVHEPVGAGRCTDCHRVHTSDQRPLLIQRIPELCMDCHPVDASHVARNTLCTSCHGVHSSRTARFLKGERTRNCGSCHGDKRRGDSLHAPSREGKCLICHFTHPDPRFETQGLRASYPAEPLVPYRPGIYELCAGCHERALYTDPAYLGTRFRTSSVNLHARHVVSEEGVSCSACHDLHASRRPALVVEWVRLPGRTQEVMQFLRLSTGGTCGPACHATATYLNAEEAELMGEPP